MLSGIRGQRPCAVATITRTVHTRSARKEGICHSPRGELLVAPDPPEQDLSIPGSPLWIEKTRNLIERHR